jgi:hypothetical protein
VSEQHSRKSPYRALLGEQDEDKTKIKTMVREYLDPMGQGGCQSELAVISCLAPSLEDCTSNHLVYYLMKMAVTVGLVIKASVLIFLCDTFMILAILHWPPFMAGLNPLLLSSIFQL